MKIRVVVLALFFSGVTFAQNMEDLSSLPSTKSEQKLPDMDAPEPKTVLPAAPNSPSIPQLRPPAQDDQKTKSQDWAAQGM